MGTRNAWEKTRQDHAKESAEDYVEAIYRLESQARDAGDDRRQVRLTDLADQFQVSAPHRQQIAGPAGIGRVGERAAAQPH